MSDTEDIKKGRPQEINLLKKGKKRTFIKRNRILKEKSPIKKIVDLKSTEEEHFLYIQGNQIKPPKYLGNLLKIAFFGLFILLLINSINIYFTGKKIEKEISSHTNEGYQLLLDGGKDASKTKFENALQTFEKAKESFAEAGKELWFVKSDNSIYSEDSSVVYAANAIIEGGEHFAVAGEYFLKSIEDFNKLPLYFVKHNENAASLGGNSITEELKKGLKNTSLAFDQINLAANKIDKITVPKLPLDVQQRVLLAKEKLHELSVTLSNISSHFPAILKILGDTHPHKVMVLLQNNYELRPTGGFIGSYLLFDINDGYIENLSVHDVYDIDGSYGGVIEPPDELKLLTDNWRFRDSNYSPDFPTSAAKARWFMEVQGGPTVDTIIAINQGLLRDMLEITGPVQVGNFGKLRSDNYNLLLSYVIEGKIWGPEDPKHILKVFVPAFKEAILKEKNLSKIAAKLYRAIQQKHIMMYSSDSDIQDLFEYLGFSGKSYAPQKNEDFLSVINSSIGGTKSDQFIEEIINHHTEISKRGEIVNELEITRKHLWTDSFYLQWEKMLKEYGLSLNNIEPRIVDVLGRGRNEVNMRIYVPEGSVLLESNDPKLVKKYDKDLKKDYFYTRIEVRVGESKTLKVKYSLPFQLDMKNAAENYKLIAEKQPGTRGSLLNKTLKADKLKLIGMYPEGPKVNPDNSIIYNTNLVYDRYFSCIIRP